jgi:hypothetical protein
MKPFQILDLPNDDYHGSPEYFEYKSRSRITRFINHGRAGLGCEKRGISLFSGNAGTSLGTVVDTWLDHFASDPKVHPSDLFVTPPADVLSSNGQRRGKAYSTWLEEQTREVVSDTEMEKAVIMADRIKGNPLAMELIESTVCTQRCIFWESPEGHKLKIRADGDDGRVPWDLKTTSAPIDAFPGKAVQYGYHHQAAMYLDGFAAMGLLDDPYATDFKFLVVQSIPPYRVRVTIFPQQVVDYARAQVYDALEEMRDAEASGCYFDPADLTVTTMDVPRWALK